MVRPILTSDGPSVAGFARKSYSEEGGERSDVCSVQQLLDERNELSMGFSIDEVIDKRTRHIPTGFVLTEPITHAYHQAEHEAAFSERTRPIDGRSTVATMEICQRFPRNNSVGEVLDEEGGEDAGVIGAVHGPRQKKGRCEEAVVRRHGIQAP